MPDSEIAADTLTTFFLQQKRCKVSSYVCVLNVAYSYKKDGEKAYKDNIVLADTTDYKKQMICDTKYLINAGNECDVMFLLCHGSDGYLTKEGREHEIASLCFREAAQIPRETRLWASPFCLDDMGRQHHAPPNGTTLNQVVGDSKLVILQCCVSAQIMKQYLQSAARLHEHEILVFDGDRVLDISIYVLIAWLIIEIESLKVRPSTIIEIVRSGITKIIEDIASCGDDADKFWSKLLSYGCVSFINPPDQNAQCTAYSIEGSICKYVYEYKTDTKPSTPEKLLANFKKLTLIRCSPSLDEPERTTVCNVHPDSAAEHPPGCTVSQQVPPLHLLLDQLNTLANGS